MKSSLCSCEPKIQQNMDVVALPGTSRQFRRRKWNFVQKLNNFDFVAIAAVCCFFVRRGINKVQNYFESTDPDAILNDTIRNEKKNCDCPWTTLTGKHWKWREKFQAPAARRNTIAQMDQKFLFRVSFYFQKHLSFRQSLTFIEKLTWRIPGTISRDAGTL